MKLSEKTLSGTIWHFAQQLVRRGINFIVTLLLASYLSPSDFGLVAMMTLFLALGSSLMDSGFKQALIRKQDATQIDCNTVFYANLVLGLVSYALLFIAAPWIADFYDEPNLVNLIRVAAFGIVINSFIVVQSAQMHQQLNFKVEMQTAMPSSLISGLIAVALAYLGIGVWALVIQMLTFSILNTALLWLKQRWRPSLSFSYDSLIEMYSFGYKLFLSGILEIIFKNIYVVTIAKLFISSVAGYYFFAEKIKDMIINQLVSSIQTVTYPAFVNLQGDDDRLKAGYRKAISVTAFFLFPAMISLAALANPVFELFLPEQWLPTVPYLQLLCVAGLLNPITSMNMNLLKVKGRSDLYLYIEVIKKIMIVIVFCLSVQFGVIGILIGQIISSVLIFFPNSYFSSKLIGYSVKEQIADFFASLFLSIVIGGIVFYGISFVDWSPLLQLVIFGFFSVILYSFTAYILRFRAFLLLVSLAKNRMAVDRK